MADISPTTLKLLRLSFLRGVGPSSLRKAVETINFATTSIDEISKNVSSVRKALEESKAWENACDAAAFQVENAAAANARIMSPLDEGYPNLLAATPDDPFILYVLGNLTTVQNGAVAIVGTREPTAHGTLITKRITTFFVEQGWSIVSGLALGCDGIAHQATLDEGGHTIAVLAHGLQTVAPTRHRALASKILEAGGALVSEFPFGRSAAPQQFVKRDRTQAGLAQGVVMIQSDLRGGSLHASRAALSYRRWLAIPYPTTRDLDNREPKVQANLMIADGKMEDRIELLRCDSDQLSLIKVLRGKEDYNALLQGASHLQHHTLPPFQNKLL